ncbi:MAG TPA: methanogenesis marker 8 protein [Candidatus Acidoferrales bacterium]|nr:methanogenesis marker 8 protein [Candidatus Acidoferrales bacterium]
MTEKHVVEALGKTYIVIEDGNVVEVGEPLINWCPIFAKARGISEITPESIRKNIEFRIKDFGMCTEDRSIEMQVFVGFGASEVMMSGLRRGMLDASVTVCEGVGTVITSNPALAQGIGARISGVIETTVIPNLVKRVEDKGGVTLDSKQALINQPLGVIKAVELGNKRVAVTVTTVEDATKCREVEANTNTEVTIIGVHMTGIDKDAAAKFVDVVDITTGCASLSIRVAVKGKALAQVGTAVPLFAMTQRGKELLLERAKEVSSPILINTTDLPVVPDDEQPRPLV